jgi:hypothetical protein
MADSNRIPPEYEFAGRSLVDERNILSAVLSLSIFSNLNHEIQLATSSSGSQKPVRRQAVPTHAHVC